MAAPAQGTPKAAPAAGKAARNRLRFKYTCLGVTSECRRPAAFLINIVLPSLDDGRYTENSLCRRIRSIRPDHRTVPTIFRPFCLIVPPGTVRSSAAYPAG